MTQPTMFDMSPISTDTRTATPVAPRPTPSPTKAAQRDGMAYRKTNHSNIRSIILALLHDAGPVRVVGGRPVGGMTREELTAAVSKRRGKPTKETSLTQTMKDLQAPDREGQVWVRESAHRRAGAAGVGVTVYEHVNAMEGKR